METFKFKTNIKCGGCIATVTPALNDLKAVKHWEVDLNNPDRILTIEADCATDETGIINALRGKGYDATLV